MDWQKAVQQAIELRHWFHKHPELTWQEENTAKKIRECLDKWNIAWRPCATYGTIAVLAADKPGEHLAFRADMDALPIQEQTDLSYCSTASGKMHACGHDGHMAALLGTALWLKHNESQLKNPITLLFQPAEEGGHGAKKMIEDGALEGIDMIFGWHNWPAMALSTAACPNGPVMSSNGSFKIEVTGIGGHASQPEACRDPVIAAAAITLNLQQIVSRRLPPQAAAVVSLTSIVAESSITIIPQKVQMSGGIRLSDSKYRTQINELIQQIAEDTAKSYGVTAQVEVFSRYDATVNNPEAAERYRSVLKTTLGDDFNQTELMMPLMASEDFSYYLKEVPGAFALIGMKEEIDGQDEFCYPCHNPHYKFNDRLIEMVMLNFSKLSGIK
ncbi:N(2)-acetyl-L-2,4-diaminobutanoate deacetylase DoeB2 [Thiomicrorhabdus hydrogeniphila]